MRESIERLSAIDELLANDVVKVGAAPVAAAMIAGWTPRGWQLFYGGFASAWLVGDPLGWVFDLASITKPMTASLVLSLADQGVLSLDDSLSKHVLSIDLGRVGDATIEQLLAHEAGLRAWVPLYLDDAKGPFFPSDRSLPPADAPMDFSVMLERAARAVDRAPGFAQVYSDLGYVLVAQMLREKGLEIEADLATRFGATTTPDPALTAPTEIVAWRGEVRGEVHDENAYFMRKCGVFAGHAGAFGGLQSVFRLAHFFWSALRGESDCLSQKMVHRALTRRSVGTFKMGWDGKSAQNSSAGRLFSIDSFGHLGFTGTSVWVDPQNNRIAILLTNRTYPTRANNSLRAIRPRVVDQLVAILERNIHKISR